MSQALKTFRDISDNYTKCQYCTNYKGRTRQQYSEHQIKCHNEEYAKLKKEMNAIKPFACNICQQRFLKQAGVLKHQRNVKCQPNHGQNDETLTSIDRNLASQSQQSKVELSQVKTHIDEEAKVPATFQKNSQQQHSLGSSGVISTTKLNLCKDNDKKQRQVQKKTLAQKSQSIDTQTQAKLAISQTGVQSINQRVNLQKRQGLDKLMGKYKANDSRVKDLQQLRDSIKLQQKENKANNEDHQSNVASPELQSTPVHSKLKVARLQMGSGPSFNLKTNLALQNSLNKKQGPALLNAQQKQGAKRKAKQIQKVLSAKKQASNDEVIKIKPPVILDINRKEIVINTKEENEHDKESNQKDHIDKVSNEEACVQKQADQIEPSNMENELKHISKTTDKVEDVDKLDEKMIKRIASDFSKKFNHRWGEVFEMIPSLVEEDQYFQSNYFLRSDYTAVMNKQMLIGNPQVGYGEISYAGIKNILDAIMLHAPYNNDSVFCDIGSGFGGCVFIIASIANALTIGYEVVAARYNFSVDFMEQLKKEMKGNTNFESVYNNCKYYLKNIEGMGSIDMVEIGKKITHVYCFDYVMSKETRVAVADLVSKSPDIKCLAWTTDQNLSNYIGLKGFIQCAKVPQVSLRGSQQKMNFYIYKKEDIIIEGQNIDHEIVGHSHNYSQNIAKQLKNQHTFTQDNQCQDITMKEMDLYMDEDSEKNKDFRAKVISKANEKVKTILPIVVVRDEDTFEIISNSIKKKISKKIDYSNFCLKWINTYVNIDEVMLKEKEAIVQQSGQENCLSIIFGKDQTLKLIFRLNTIQTQELIKLCQELFIETRFKNVIEMKTKGFIQKMKQNKQNIENRYQKQIQQVEKNILHFKDLTEKLLYDHLQNQNLFNIKYLGSGMSSLVYSCKMQSDPNKDLALKIPKTKYEKYLRQEFQNLTKFKNNKSEGNYFVIEIVGTVDLFQDTAIGLLLEYCPYSLTQVLKEPLSRVQRDLIAYCIICGVAYAHKLKVYHQDLKPDNILLTDKWIPKIADWGQSKIYKAGTKEYQGPEHQIDKENVKLDSGDSWALGLILKQLNTNSKDDSGEDFSSIAVGTDPYNSIVRELQRDEPNLRSLPSQALSDSYWDHIKPFLRPDLDIKNIGR